MKVSQHQQEYYATHGVITDPEEVAQWLAPLPGDVAALCEIVQGLVIHVHWAERYGLSLSKERRQEPNLRRVSRQLRRIIELDDRPLTETRPKEQRLVGTCRDYSTLMAAILRYQGVPARARCGFGAYFTPGRFEDHWVFEYWDGEEGRWRMAGAQIDAFQQDALGLSFDTLDMPSGRFLPAGEAWRRCRRGEADPDLFGIFDMHGLWFITGNLVRDVLALNKTELLPWDGDGWGMMPAFEQTEFSSEYLTTLDRLAELTLASRSEIDLAAVAAAYQDDRRLQSSEDWQP